MGQGEPLVFHLAPFLFYRWDGGFAKLLTMKPQPGITLIRNGTLIDGTGAPPVPDAAVVVSEGIITYAGAAAGLPQLDPDMRTIDAMGGTILPGLIEAHIHLTYFNVTELQDLDIKYPVEYVTLQSAVNAKTALECGYTAARHP